MATKSKTESVPKAATAPSQPAPSPLATAFAKAVKLVDAGKHAEAAKALEHLMEEARLAGDWAIKRGAQVYLALTETHLHPPKAVAADPVTEIQACLNRGERDEALKLTEKAIKAHPGHGKLHYLRSVAFAQSGNTEASADCLKKALELDGDLVYQWHMEPDFNAIRKSPLFGFTESR